MTTDYSSNHLNASRNEMKVQFSSDNIKNEEHNSDHQCKNTTEQQNSFGSLKNYLNHIKGVMENRFSLRKTIDSNFNNNGKKNLIRRRINRIGSTRPTTRSSITDTEGSIPPEKPIDSVGSLQHEGKPSENGVSPPQMSKRSLDDTLDEEFMTLPRKSEKTNIVPLSTNKRKKAACMCFCAGRPSLKPMEKEICRLENTLMNDLPVETMLLLKEIYLCRRKIRNDLYREHDAIGKFSKCIKRQAKKKKEFKKVKKIDKFLTCQCELLESIFKETENMKRYIGELQFVEHQPVTLLKILHYLSQEGADLQLKDNFIKRISDKESDFFFNTSIDQLRIENGKTIYQGDGILSVNRNVSRPQSTTSGTGSTIVHKKLL